MVRWEDAWHSALLAAVGLGAALPPRPASCPCAAIKAQAGVSCMLTTGHAAGDGGACPLLIGAADPDNAQRAGKSDISSLLVLLKRREVLAICAAQYTQSWGLYGDELSSPSAAQSFL